jgi:hypothetical protein
MFVGRLEGGEGEWGGVGEVEVGGQGRQWKKNGGASPSFPGPFTEVVSP